MTTEKERAPERCYARALGLVDGVATNRGGSRTNDALSTIDHGFAVAGLAAAGFQTWPIEMRSSFLRPP